MTPKQQRFVEQYLIDLNGTQAAVRAGYSPQTAVVQGSRLLSNVNVQRVIAARIADRSRRVEIDQDLVIRELAAIASIDIRKLFAEDGSPRPIRDLHDDLAAAISSLEMVIRQAKDGSGAEYVYRVRFWDKLRALELLGRHLGMFSGRRDVGGSAGEPLLPGLTDEELVARLRAKRSEP